MECKWGPAQRVLVAVGTPEQVARAKSSATDRALSRLLIS
jgi:hypothetical protein